MKFLVLVVLLASLQPTAAPANDWQQSGEWQSMISDDTCALWTVTTRGPNSQVWFRVTETTSLHMHLRGADWDFGRSPFAWRRDNTDQVRLIVRPAGERVDIKVINIMDKPTLIKSGNEEDWDRLEAFFRVASSSGGVVLAENSLGVIGVYSMEGHDEMRARFLGCMQSLHRQG